MKTACTCDRNMNGSRPTGASVRIVSLCCVFPNPADWTAGTFVRSRLAALGALVPVQVVAPVRAALGNWLSNDVPTERAELKLRISHPRWLHVPGSGVLTPFSLAVQLIPTLRRIGRRSPFDLLDAHFGYPEGIAAAVLARIFGVPFSITFRGSELLHSRYFLRRRAMAFAVKRAAFVFAVSEELRQLAVGLGARPQQTRTVPNGVNTDVFFRRDRQAMRAKHGIPAQCRSILTAGHLIELKGHHVAISAVHRLRETDLNARLYIAGAAPNAGVANYEQRLHGLVRQLGAEDYVTFLGPLNAETLAEYMCAADVFCHASFREGWPNVVHEALSCGTPAVATRVGGGPMLVSDSISGFLVEPGDPVALTDALKRSLERNWDYSGIASAAGGRSWEQVAATLLEVFATIVPRRERVNGATA